MHRCVAASPTWLAIAGTQLMTGVRALVPRAACSRKTAAAATSTTATGSRAFLPLASSARTWSASLLATTLLVTLARW